MEAQRKRFGRVGRMHSIDCLKAEAADGTKRQNHETPA